MGTTALSAAPLNFRRLTLIAAIAAVALPPSVRGSTNGDNLLGVGAVARSLGGNGSAAPQDVLSAVSGNPAGLSFLPGDLDSEADVSVTIFVPNISATVGSFSANSGAKTYLVPSLGVARPLGNKDSTWQYGFAVYGLAGAGVNYNNSALSGTLGATPFPLVAGGYTQFETIEMASSLAYRVSSQLSLGIAFDV